MSTVYDWGRLTREEIEAFAATALTVIPVGTTEQHGPHLATCTDALLAETLALRAAEAATAPEVILLAPTLAYGASHHHVPFGGTLSLDVDTLQRVLADLLASAAASGCATGLRRQRPRRQRSRLRYRCHRGIPAARDRRGDGADRGSPRAG